MIIKRKEFERMFSGGVGIVVKQNRFVSSSNDMNVAFKFASKKRWEETKCSFFIKVEGKNGRDISRISEFKGNFVPENQQEVLFTNNTPFYIDRLEDKGDVIWLYMTKLWIKMNKTHLRKWSRNGKKQNNAGML